jgi:hypothetical protein
MDLAALQNEVAARGTDYLGTRGTTYINLARAQLDAMYLWPYRKASATGSPGTGIVTPAGAAQNQSALASVYLVQDTANNYATLRQASEGDLRECYGDLSISGVPFAYYITRTGSAGTVNAYPVGGTLQAFYYMVTPDLAGPTDTPLAPSQYHGLIVDMAIQMAYRDSDDHDMAEKLQVWIDRQLARMVNDLFADQTMDLQPLSFSSSDW